MTQSSLIEIGAAPIYFEIHGRGDPLVLLHGALGTIQSCFAALLPRLAQTHRVIAVELQGHGHTPDTDRVLTYPNLAGDVHALLEHLGTGPVDVVGYSLGGAVAIELAIRHPALTRRVVFAGAPSFRPDGLHPEIIAGLDAPHDTFIDALQDSVWHRAYRSVAPDPSQWPQLVAKVNQLDNTFTGWTADALHTITSPVMLIAGDADLVRPEHVVEMFRSLGGGRPGDIVPLPDARLAILPGTSHIGLLDRVDWLHSMIDDFLNPPPHAPHNH